MTTSMGQRRLARRLAVVAAVAVGFAGAIVVLPGCEEDGASSSSASAKAEAPFVAAWKAAGFESSEFQPMAGAGIAGGTCVAGQVNKLEAVLCRYQDEAAAKGAEAAGFTYIGETTGTALSKGSHLLVIADRNKADPSGKTLDKVAKTFLELEAEGGKKAAKSDEAAKSGEAAKPDKAAKPSGE